MVPVSYFLSLAAMLFGLGLLGALIRRNALIVLMSVELMLNAVNLTFIAYARMWGSATGQVIAFFVIALAAAEAAIGLAILVGIYRSRRTVNLDEMNLMKN